jgi:hypothetical protein
MKHLPCHTKLIEEELRTWRIIEGTER